MSTIGVSPATSSWQPIFNNNGDSTSPTETTEMTTDEMIYLSVCIVALISFIATFVLKRKS